MIKKVFISLGVVLLLSFASCGGGSSKEAKALLQKILNLVGIPQTIVVNICQDENRDGVCGVNELQAKVSINKGDTVATIWKRLERTEDGKYLLETYDPTLPLLLVLKDTNSQHYTEEFTIPFNGLESTQTEKELSLLQAMVDAGHLSADDISAVKEIDNQDIFYETLLKDFEINLNTLTKNELSSPTAVLANLAEMAEELKDAGISDELPAKIDACEDDSCVKEVLEETIITEDESKDIKDNETQNTKSLLAGKTFYLYNNETNAIEKLIINDQADSWVHRDETENINIKGDRLTFPKDNDDSYTIIIKRDDYLELTDYHADGSIDGNGHRLYFNEAKAKEYANSSTPTSALKKALDNKTWGEYKEGENELKTCYIFRDNKIIGYSDGDKSKEIELTYTIKDNTLNYFLNGKKVSSTDTFSKIDDSTFNVHKVWEDDESNRVWKVTENCTENMGKGEEATPSGFTKEMLQDKVVYFQSYVEEDGTKGYAKMSFSSTSVIMHDIGVQTNGEENDNGDTTLSYTLEDGKVKMDYYFSEEENSFIFWTLRGYKDNEGWYITEESDEQRDGTIDSSEDKTVYFSKPSDYPAQL